MSYVWIHYFRRPIQEQFNSSATTIRTLMYFISFVRDGGHECLNKDPCVIFSLLYQQTLASVGQTERGVGGRVEAYYVQ